jgi:photosystem II stability/assembly factor-like uncharacterized protein
VDWLKRIARTSRDLGTGRLRFGGRLFIFGSVLATSLLLAWVFSPSVIGQQQTIGATEHQRDGADLIRKRAEWFLHQREFPLGFIPAGAREKALEQRDQMIRERGTLIEHLAATVNAITPNTTTWTAIGPQPTAGPVNQFGNVSGRILAMAVDPRDMTGNTVYMGGAVGGVWKTTDGGTTWTPKTDFMPSLAISALALDTTTTPSQTIIYAGTGEGDFGFDSYWSSGLLKSTDSGATWSSIGAGAFGGAPSPINEITEGPFFFALGAQPNTANPVLLAALRGSGSVLQSGIWRSTTGGTSWSLVFPPAGQTGNIGTDVVFDPATPSTAYAAIGVPFSVQANPVNGIYKSTDGGQTWTSLNTKITTSIPTLSQANFGRISLGIGSGVLFAAIADHSKDSGPLLAMIKSTDGGQTWTKLPLTGIPGADFCAQQCWFDNVVKVSPTNSSLVIVGGGAIGSAGSTVFRSTDGGNTWIDASFTGSQQQTVHVDQHAAAFSSDGTKYYIGNDGGAWNSTSVTNPNTTTAQITWTNLNNTLQLTEFYPHVSIHPSNNQDIIGGAQDNGTQQFSGSLAWTDMQVCGDGGYTAFDLKTPTTVYAGCEYVPPNTGFNPINKSLSSGSLGTFVKISTGINLSDPGSFIPPLVIDPTNTQTLYFGTNKVYQTTNGGTQWTPISPDLTTGGGAFISTVAVAPSSSATVYVGTVDGLVWITTNATAGSGATFTQVTGSNLPPRSITQVVVDPTNPQSAFLTFSGFANCPQLTCDHLGHVFHTINGGAAWTDISVTLPDIPVNDVAIDPNDSTRNTLYLATDVGAFGTTDGGVNWTPLASGLPNVEVTTIALHQPSRILVAGTHGRGAWSLQLPGAGNTSPVDFSFGTPSPASATITAGQSTMFSIAVTPASSSTAGITISCAGLPAGTTCTPSPNPVPESGASTLQVTLQTTGRSTVPGSPTGPLRPWGRFELLLLISLATLCLAIALLKFGPRRRLAFGLAAGMLIAFAGFQVGCGGGGGGTTGGGTPIASFNPTSVTFHNLTEGTTSAAQTVTLTNSGTASLSITNIAITGANSADFALASNNCPASLMAGANCTMTVTLKPSVATAENAAISVSDNAAGSPQTVALTGTAGTPAGTSTITITGTAGSFTHTTQVTLTVQ